MAWEENSCISLNMQLIAILSRIGVILTWKWTEIFRCCHLITVSIAIKSEKMSPIVNCWTADILCLTIWNALNGKLSSQLGALFNTF